MSAISNILCVGDSLTAGYYGSQTNYTPYAATLGQQLGCTVHQIGKSGWRVDEIVTHMANPSCVDVFNGVSAGLTIALAQEKYAAAIIMAGTNDLPTDASAEAIVAGLIQLHQECHNRSLRTVALSVPESRFTGTMPAMGVKRQQVNLALQQWAATQNGKVVFVDMSALMPYSDHNGEWDADGLHMSPHGYTQFGAILASQLSAWHKPRISSSPPRNVQAVTSSPTSSPVHARRASAPSVFGVSAAPVHVVAGNRRMSMVNFF